MADTQLVLTFRTPEERERFIELATKYQPHDRAVICIDNRAFPDDYLDYFVVGWHRREVAP